MADINEVNGVFGGVEINTGAENYNNQPTNEAGTMENHFNFVNDGVNNTTNENIVNFANPTAENVVESNNKKNTNLPTKVGFWNKFKGFWLQEIKWDREIKVELTPKQQKVENEINGILHKEITWEKVHDFLFQEISFGKKSK